MFLRPLGPAPPQIGCPFFEPSQSGKDRPVRGSRACVMAGIVKEPWSVCVIDLTTLPDSTRVTRVGRRTPKYRRTTRRCCHRRSQGRTAQPPTGNARLAQEQRHGGPPSLHLQRPASRHRSQIHVSLGEKHRGGRIQLSTIRINSGINRRDRWPIRDIRSLQKRPTGHPLDLGSPSLTRCEGRDVDR